MTPQIVSVPALQAWEWFKQSVVILRENLFKLFLFQLFSVCLVYTPTALALIFKPFIGELASGLVQIAAQVWILVISGGVLFYFDQLLLKKDPEFSAVFKPIERAGPPLIGSFIILFGIAIGMFILLTLFGIALAYLFGISFEGSSFETLTLELVSLSALGIKNLIWFSILLFLVLLGLLTFTMASYFSTGLIVLYDMQAWPSIKASIRGVTANVWPLSLISAIIAVLIFPAMLFTLGLYALVAFAQLGVLQVVIIRAIFKQEGNSNNVSTV